MSKIVSDDDLKAAVSEIRDLNREMYGDIRQINQHLDELNGQVARNTKRSEKNEAWLFRGVGGLTVLGALGAVLLALLQVV